LSGRAKEQPKSSRKAKKDNDEFNQLLKNKINKVVSYFVCQQWQCHRLNTEPLTAKSRNLKEYGIFKLIFV